MRRAAVLLVLAALLGVALARLVVLGPSLPDAPLACVAANIGSTAFLPHIYISANISYNSVAQGRIVNSFDAQGDLTGSVVLFDLSWRNVNIADELERVAALNASAVLITSTLTAPGRAVALLKERYYHQKTFKKAYETLPVYQISGFDCHAVFDRTLPKSTSTLFAIIEKETELNPWEVFVQGPWSTVFQVVMAIWALIVLGFIIFRIFHWLKYRDSSNFRFVMVILTAELFCTVLRVLFIVDPVGFRSLFDPFSLNFFITPHVTVSLANDFLILSYWNGAIRAFGEKFSRKWLKKTVYTVVGILIVLETISATIRSLDHLSALYFTYIMQVFYVGFQILLFSYTIYTAVGLYRFIQSSQTLTMEQKRVKKSVLRMTNILITSMAVILVSMFFSASASFLFYTYPFQFYFFFTFADLLGCTMSFTHLLILRLPRRRLAIPSSIQTQMKNTTQTTMVETTAVTSYATYTEEEQANSSLAGSSPPAQQTYSKDSSGDLQEGARSRLGKKFLRHIRNNKSHGGAESYASSGSKTISDGPASLASEAPISSDDEEENDQEEQSAPANQS